MKNDTMLVGSAGAAGVANTGTGCEHLSIYNRVAAGSRAWHRLIECVNHLAHNFRFEFAWCSSVTGPSTGTIQKQQPRYKHKSQTKLGKHIGV